MGRRDSALSAQQGVIEIKRVCIPAVCMLAPRVQDSVAMPKGGVHFISLPLELLAEFGMMA